jgi:surface polysaccharide O-acyltransferase-like enzyme
MEKRHGAKELAGKFDGIFYPYIIWSFVIGIFEILGSGYRNGQTTFASLLGVMWEPRGILWFLYALFEAFALTELLIYFFGVKRARLLVVPVAIVLLALWQPRPLLFAISEFQMSFIYFAVGVLLAPRMRMEQATSIVTATVSLAAIFGCLYAAHAVFDMKTTSFRSVSPNATILAMLVLALFLLFCYSLPVVKMAWLAKLGERSMDIYLLHLLLIAPVRIVLQKFVGISNPAIIICIGLPIGVVGSLMVADGLKRLKLGWLFTPTVALSLKSKLVGTKLSE